MLELSQDLEIDLQLYEGRKQFEYYFPPANSNFT